MSPIRRGKNLLQDALHLNNLYRAWEQVRRNKAGPGEDRITLARFERRLELNLSLLADRVARGAYRPGKVRMVVIRTGRKRREIAIWCVADRVLQRAVLNTLEPVFEPTFHRSSFGYRSGLGVADAVKRVLWLRDHGHTWVVDADIRDCFPSIDHGILMGLLRRRVNDQDLIDLVSLWLPLGRPKTVRRSNKAVGISLGAVISPLLCNVYLHQLDDDLYRARLQAVRYADDFVVMCRAESEQIGALSAIRTSLVPLKLEVNSEKTRLTTFEEGFDFLGVRFKEGHYSYLWHDKRVLAEDLGETFPLEIDGYGW